MGKTKYKVEMYQDKKKEWRWRLKAPNGKIIAHGEGYKRRSTMEKTILTILNLRFYDSTVNKIICR